MLNVIALINSGEDVNACNFKGVTPLHVSAIYNAKEISQVLIDHEADINKQDIYQDNIL